MLHGNRRFVSRVSSVIKRNSVSRGVSEIFHLSVTIKRVRCNIVQEHTLESRGELSRVFGSRNYSDDRHLSSWRTDRGKKSGLLLITINFRAIAGTTLAAGFPLHYR